MLLPRNSNIRTTAMDCKEVDQFWFSLSIEEQMKGKDGLDDEIRNRFLDLYETAKSRQLDSWRYDPNSCTSLIVLLDQFSRNMFRGTKRAFECDDYALELSEFAIDQGYLERVSLAKKMFILLPLQHSECLDTNRQCLKLWIAHASEIKKGITMTQQHITILERFGRYPHRNQALDRKSTDEELEYITSGNLTSFETSQLKARSSCRNTSAAVTA